MLGVYRQLRTTLGDLAGSCCVFGTALKEQSIKADKHWMDNKWSELNDSNQTLLYCSIVMFVCCGNKNKTVLGLAKGSHNWWNQSVYHNLLILINSPRSKLGERWWWCYKCSLLLLLSAIIHRRPDNCFIAPLAHDLALLLLRFFFVRVSVHCLLRLSDNRTKHSKAFLEINSLTTSFKYFVVRV